MKWKESVQNNRVRSAIGFCLISGTFMALYIPTFYQEVINSKKGFIIIDPVLQFLNPVNWSLLTFFILYVVIFHTLVTGIKNPAVFITGLTTYCAVSLVRMVTMYILTLEAPPGMILLSDPISSILYPDSGFAKDLFFSGHVSTMVIMVLVERSATAKFIKIICTVIVGVLLAWQHVHYSIDLLAAPIATYCVFYGIQKYLGFVQEGSNPTKNAKNPLGTLNRNI